MLNNHDLDTLTDTLLASLAVSRTKQLEAIRKIDSDIVAEQRQRSAKSRVQMVKDVVQSRASKKSKLGTS
jgi:hypothetical protein